jgi:tetratricopeptide (TPR) repeat protein
MGYRGVGLSFDTGWALLRLQRWKEAIEKLDYFEVVVPGRAKTSEFLGRAYLALGDFDQAEAKLQEAIERDPKVKPTALIYLAALEQKRGNPQRARQYLETIVRDAPQSPIARDVAQKLKPSPAAVRKQGK